MKNDFYTTKLINIIDNSTDTIAIITALRLLAEIEGVLPKPYILYEGSQLDEEKAKKSKVSLLNKIINKFKK